MERREFDRLMNPIPILFHLNDEPLLKGFTVGLNPNGFAAIVEPVSGKKIARAGLENVVGMVAFDLKAVEILPVKCQIIRSDNLEKEKTKVFMVFRILEIDEHDKKMLMEYIHRDK